MIKTRRLAVPGFFGWGRKTYNYFERLFERLSELFCEEEEEEPLLLPFPLLDLF